MMFCSSACKEDLYLKAFNMNKIASADIKMLSEIAAVFESVQNFDNIMQRTDLKELNKTIFDFDFTNPEDPDYKKNLMICLLSLCRNDQSFGECCDIHNYVSEKAAKHVLSIFNLNRKQSNFFVNKSEYIEVGCHVSLFASLINHSCLNNAFNVLVDNKVVTIMQNRVNAGDQIFFNYM